MQTKLTKRIKGIRHKRCHTCDNLSLSLKPRGMSLMRLKGTLMHRPCKHLTIVPQSFNQTVSSHIKGQTLRIRTAKFKRIHQSTLGKMSGRGRGLLSPCCTTRSRQQPRSVCLLQLVARFLSIHSGNTKTTC